MIAEVVRIFEDEDIHHVAGAVDPLQDIEVINTELIMADLETVTKRLDGIAREVKRGEKDAVTLADVLTKLQKHLEMGNPARSLSLGEGESSALRELHLLTVKPVLYVCNRKQGSFNFDEQQDDRWQELCGFFTENNAKYTVVDAGVEHELKDLAEEEKMEFRREYGAQDSGIDNLIRASYDTLGLMSFFTTGEKETRAWTVPVGATAPVAGGVIHSDFKDKFIRAHVVSFENFVQYEGLPGARTAGHLRTEGKEYIVQDGDVIHFRFNV